ncbi:MAG: LPS export ABC transporter permease LptG [Thiohalospira sp.]
MRVLDRYIAMTVIGSSLAALAVLLSLYVFLTFVEQLNDHSVGVALGYTLLTVPGWTNDLFPIAALLGGLLGLGRLASSSELTVMQAAGVSIARITAGVFAGGLVLMSFVVVMGEMVAPEANAMADQIRSGESREALRLPGGEVWLRAGEHVVHARRVPAPEHMSRLTLYEYDARNRLLAMRRADDAYYREGRGWSLEGVRISHFRDTRVETESVDEYTWRDGPEPRKLEFVATDPRRLGLLELHEYIDYLTTNELTSTVAELTFWRKLVAPLTTAGMLLLALPFVMGSLRTVAVGSRIFIGTLIGIVFFLFNHSFGNLSVIYGVPPWLGAFFPTFLIFLSSGLMAFRLRSR